MNRNDLVVGTLYDVQILTQQQRKNQANLLFSCKKNSEKNFDFEQFFEQK